MVTDDPFIAALVEQLPADVDIVVVRPPRVQSALDPTDVQRAETAELEVIDAVRAGWACISNAVPPPPIDVTWTDGFARGLDAFVAEASVADALIAAVIPDDVATALTAEGWETTLVAGSATTAVLARVGSLFAEVQFRPTDNVVALRVRSSPLALGEAGRQRTARGQWQA